VLKGEKNLFLKKYFLATTLHSVYAPCGLSISIQMNWDSASTPGWLHAGFHVPVKQWLLL